LNLLQDMALADDIRAEMAKVEIRMTELKVMVKKQAKTQGTVSPALSELRQLHVRQTELETNLARALTSHR
jgi:hypothetical protein